MKRLLGSLALIFFGVVLALLVADVGIRIANHWFPYFYCYDEHRGWGLNPGAHGWYRREGVAYVRINRDGFRGPDYPKAKPPGTIRIAVIGDSYVEAIQVPEDKTFTAVAGRDLSDCPDLKGKRIEAMNFGVDGYGSAQELETLNRKVWAYEPDIVVMAIFLGNDIRNNSVALEGDQCRPFYVYRGGGLALAGPFMDSPAYRMWCAARFDYRDLRLLGIFQNAWEVITKGPGQPTPEHPVERAINYSIYKPPADAAWKNAWSVTEGLITAVRDDVERHHAMFLAVTEDTGIQVWPDSRVRKAFEEKRGVPDLFYP
ncbi:MAG TPA: SGNH/GDSL hydrolase family protein, partial [Candidatus Binataceae bacterium]|nr:SGNH/GDSL hydrolase family protein [Candidatus Binataceae bacterium]